MNEVIIEIRIKVPDGVTPSVDYGTAPARHVPSQPAASSPPPTAAGWVCPEHGSEKVKRWPDGGISCGVRGGSNVNDKGYCKHRWTAPKPGQSPSQPPPPPEPQGEYDDLPWS